MCGDSFYDQENVRNIVKFFKGLSHGVTAFLLVLNVSDIRFDEYTRNMLYLFQQLLGVEFWSRVVIVYTFVDEDKLNLYSGNIESLEDPERGMVAKLKSEYKLDIDLPVVFLSTVRTNNSPYAQLCYTKLFDTIHTLEGPFNKKFECTWFQEIRNKVEDERNQYIIETIKRAAEVIVPVVVTVVIHAAKCNVM